MSWIRKSKQRYANWANLRPRHWGYRGPRHPTPSLITAEAALLFAITAGFTNRKTGKSVNKSNSAKTPTGSQGPGQDQTELKWTLDLNMKAWNRRNFIWPTFPQLTPLNLMKRVVKKPKSQMPQILLSHTHFHKTPGISAKIPVFWKCRQILRL